MRTKVSSPQIVYPASRLPGFLTRTVLAALLFAGGYWLGSGMDLADLQNQDFFRHAERVAELRTQIGTLEQERDGLQARVTELEGTLEKTPAQTPSDPKN